jgi:pilus assembly protein CpaF
MADGRRIVSGVTEITGMEGEVLTTQDIFIYEKVGIGEDGRVRGRYRATGIRPKCADRILASGRGLPAEMFEHATAVF